MLPFHLNSRVGRRLFSRFLIAALLPIGGLAWYAYHNVGELLLETAHYRLKQDSKFYGMSLIESLNRHADTLRLAAATSTPPDVASGFISLTPLGIGDRTDPGMPVPNAGQVRLRLPAERAPLLVARARDKNRLLAGEIAPAAFWDNDAAPEHFCVFNADRERLYCSPGIPAIDPALLITTSRENAVVRELRLGDEDYLLGAWHVGFLPALASPGFTVVVATPKALALEDLARFRLVFPAVVLLALALAGGLAINQIRYQMAPLGRLEESTRKLSAGVLDARTKLTGDDEFGQLGQAFDRMASHLEYKFHMLGMLSELDQAILGAADKTQVIEKVLGHIHQAIPCDRAGLIVVNPAGEGTLLTCQSDSDTGQSCRRLPVAAHELPRFPEESPWCRLPPEALPANWRAALAGGPLAELLVFPARLDGRLDSVLILAYATAPEDLDDLVQAGRSLADRLAIAASNFAREALLYHQAHYDALTDLPNRILLRDRVDQAIARAERADTSTALLLIDIDNFKQVNDSLGHSVGDHLLVEYARRLRQRVRQSDTVARLGGDEFVVVIPDLSRDRVYATLDGMVRDLGEALAAPLWLEEQQVVTPASIGIALYPENAASFEELMKMADAAMYESKRLHPGGYCFFTSYISIQTRDRFELTQELREAVARNELLLHYQPKVDAASGRLAGAEALLRWQSPKRGLVSPGVFVRLLDEMGLSIWLGEWVLDAACAQMRAWDAQGLPAIPVSINFSPLQFERTPVFERVRTALTQYGLAPERLEVEILESMAANESHDVRRNLAQLRELGVHIALDDFGTGYSSLVYLTQVPADILKLDRVFTYKLAEDSRQRDIVKLIISLAKVMDFTVVAEGVEDAAQQGLLTEMGCDLIQGYLIGRPIPPDEFAARWLARTSISQP